MAQSNRLTKEKIKSDQFIEVVLRTYEFLKGSLKPIIIGAAIIIVVVGGFSIYQHQRQENRAEAFLTYTQAVEKYQEAESDWLDPDTSDDPLASKTPEAESDRPDLGETASSGPFQAAATQFQTVFQKYSGTPFADKARYNYAKTLYYQGDYDGAVAQFQSLVEQHQPENQILALYAQKAIGNCYEQKGEYQRAIEAYTPAEDKLPSVAMREHVLADLRFAQARCYEKLERFDDALAIYKDLMDLFRANLENAIQRKSEELIRSEKSRSAKSLIAGLQNPPNVADAERLENEGNFHGAFVAYAEAIHNYKVEKDIHGGLTKERRERVNRFEKIANDFLKNLGDARRSESEERTSTALYYYGQAVGLDFAPSRKLYEKVLFRHDRIQRDQE
ncbi:MAG: tetratricopeptide repeat protein [Candidatus Poribacteria bacterium]|nr:tetratricopeptide repeat protein [Candidatus Poribacteria bacterium]